jgi:hypothetical protein
MDDAIHMLVLLRHAPAIGRGSLQISMTQNMCMTILLVPEVALLTLVMNHLHLAHRLFMHTTQLLITTTMRIVILPCSRTVLAIRRINALEILCQIVPKSFVVALKLHAFQLS